MNFKKIIPHIVAVAVFLIVSCVYFAPSFSDYSLNQGDIQQFKGMAKEISDFRLMNDGEEPLWTNSMFGGMPAYQISIAYPYNVLKYVDQFIRLGLPEPVGMLFVAMLGFYILTLCLGVKPWIGIIGAVAFGLSTINILYIGAGHVTKVNAIAYMAPTLGGLILAFRGKWLLGAAVFALFLGLNISANHLQMTYYLLILLSAVALSESIVLIIKKRYLDLGKVVGILLVAGLIAVLPSIGNVLSTNEYSKYTTRGTTDLTLKQVGTEDKKTVSSGLESDYILEYNYGKRELLSIIAPTAKGEKGGYLGSDEDAMLNAEPQYAEQIAQMNHYWGGQRMSGGAFYFGVVMLVFFIFGLIFLKDALKWPLLMISILVLLLASNDPGGVNNFFINKIPLYNKFRDSKMILVLLQVMIPTLGVLFLDRLLKKEGLLGNKKAWLITGGVLTFVMILFYAVPSLSGSFMSKDEVKMFADASAGAQDAANTTYISELKNNLVEVRQGIASRDFGRAVFLVIVGSLIIIAAAYTKLSAMLLTAVAFIAVTADNMSVSKRYLNNDGLDETNTSWKDNTTGSIAYGIETADLRILEQEKASVSGFDAQVKKLAEKMEDYIYYKNLNSSIIESLAEFGILGLNTDYRVLSMNNPFNETNTSYFHKSIGGYHGAKLKNYQEVISFQISNEMQQIGELVNNAKNQKLREYAAVLNLPQEAAQKVFDTISVGELSLNGTPVLNMLNTKYIVFDKNQNPIKNNNANGNVWFVNTIKKVNSANDEMLALESLDTKSVAVVNINEGDFASIVTKENYTKDSTAVIRLTKYGTNVLTYESKSSVETPAIFSEIYYPAGWNCYINGTEVKTFKANYILRGAVIPAGTNKIVWKFEPNSYSTSKIIALIGSLLLLLGAGFIFGRELKSRKKEVIL